LDGTKIKANASKHKAMSYERMKKREAELKAEVITTHAPHRHRRAEILALRRERRALSPVRRRAACPTPTAVRS
jgi:hypothetical protein